ncbi:MAG TPA: hypothetical protein VGI86_15775 [Acidimicrobiia bacterium]
MSTTRPGDEHDEPDDKGNDTPKSGDGGGRPHPESPLDDLFVVGAKYHEPSAAERAAAARAQERESKKAAKAHDKEIARTRRVLDGDSKSGRRGRHHREHDFSVASFERRTAVLGLLAMFVISVALSFTAFGH